VIYQRSINTAHLENAALNISDKHLDDIIDTALNERRIVGCVVLVARRGQLVYRRAAGMRDREQGMAMTPDSIFRLASITKPIVSATAMRLVEQGLIGLDDVVSHYLPHFRPRLPNGHFLEIRLRHLLTHTSGLTYRFLENSGHPYHQLNVSDGLDQPGLSLGENLGRIGEAPLAFEPGTDWRYSIATDVLGGVVEKATGLSLEETVAQHVLQPLDLADTRQS
jgi:CubicO group peptidase (beta-lactamase class C family)